mmetsp:Transcript_58594/g.154855  ORF Transcript_58594/g.154855 Transcript_58594/m.154855 type:complete len:463 (-) Transcript_58594:3588-4976(-)
MLHTRWDSLVVTRGHMQSTEFSTHACSAPHRRHPALSASYTSHLVQPAQHDGTRNGRRTFRHTACIAVVGGFLAWRAGTNFLESTVFSSGAGAVVVIVGVVGEGIRRGAPACKGQPSWATPAALALGPERARFFFTYPHAAQARLGPREQHVVVVRRAAQGPVALDVLTRAQPVAHRRGSGHHAGAEFPQPAEELLDLQDAPVAAGAVHLAGRALDEDHLVRVTPLLHASGGRDVWVHKVRLGQVAPPDRQLAVPQESVHLGLRAIPWPRPLAQAHDVPLGDIPRHQQVELPPEVAMGHQLVVRRHLLAPAPLPLPASPEGEAVVHHEFWDGGRALHRGSPSRGGLGPEIRGLGQRGLFERLRVGHGGGEEAATMRRIIPRGDRHDGVANEVVVVGARDLARQHQALPRAHGDERLGGVPQVVRGWEPQAQREKLLGDVPARGHHADGAAQGSVVDEHVFAA